MTATEGLKIYLKNEFANKRAELGISQEKMAENLNRSLMLVTCLTPETGYENAARCAKKALEEGTTLREAVLSLGYLDGAAYDRLVRPEKMV